MDPVERQQSVQPVSPQPVEHQVIKSSSQLRKILYIVLGIIILSTVIGISYYIGAEQSKAIPVDEMKIKPVGPAVTTIQKAPPPTLASPTVDPTANWLTYTGPTKFTSESFTFKYPSTWVYNPNSAYKITTPTYIEETIEMQGRGAPRPQITIDTVSNPFKVNTQQFIAQHQTQEKYPNLSLNHYITDSSVSIPGVDWVIDRNGGGASSYEGALLIKDDAAVLIDCAQCTDQLTNQILSTFKFTP